MQAYISSAFSSALIASRIVRDVGGAVVDLVFISNLRPLPPKPSGRPSVQFWWRWREEEGEERERK